MKRLLATALLDVATLSTASFDVLVRTAVTLVAENDPLLALSIRLSLFEALGLASRWRAGTHRPNGEALRFRVWQVDPADGRLTAECQSPFRCRLIEEYTNAGEPLISFHEHSVYGDLLEGGGKRLRVSPRRPPAGEPLTSGLDEPALATAMGLVVICSGWREVVYTSGEDGASLLLKGPRPLVRELPRV